MEDILGNQGSIKVGKELKEGGTLYARISKVPARSAGKLALSLQGGNLRKDAYFELCRTYDDEDDTSWTPVHRSRPIENYYSNPKWRRASIDVNRLCDGDLNREIKLALFYYDRKKDDKPMGAFYTTVNELIRTAQSASRELQNNESGAKAQEQLPCMSVRLLGRSLLLRLSLRRTTTSLNWQTTLAAMTPTSLNRQTTIEAMTLTIRK